MKRSSAVALTRRALTVAAPNLSGVGAAGSHFKLAEKAAKGGDLDRAAYELSQAVITGAHYLKQMGHAEGAKVQQVMDPLLKRLHG